MTNMGKAVKKSKTQKQSAEESKKTVDSVVEDEMQVDSITIQRKKETDKKIKRHMKAVKA